MTSRTFFGSMSSRWFCTNCTMAVKSDWLNSYGMFQPSIWNFLRSSRIEWKKQSEKSSFLYLKPTHTHDVITDVIDTFYILQ